MPVPGCPPQPRGGALGTPSHRALLRGVRLPREITPRRWRIRSSLQGERFLPARIRKSEDLQLESQRLPPGSPSPPVRLLLEPLSVPPTQPLSRLSTTRITVCPSAASNSQWLPRPQDRVLAPPRGSPGPAPSRALSHPEIPAVPRVHGTLAFRLGTCGSFCLEHSSCLLIQPFPLVHSYYVFRSLLRHYF